MSREEHDAIDDVRRALEAAASRLPLDSAWRATLVAQSRLYRSALLLPGP